MRLSELQTKKIINVTNGRILGMIIDVIVSNDGKIKSLILFLNIFYDYNRHKIKVIVKHFFPHRKSIQKKSFFKDICFLFMIKLLSNEW